jgi:phosphopantetheinyl transferase
VHLWLCDVATAAGFDDRVLSDDERRRYEKRPEGRVARVWLRHVLSRYLQQPPERWQFARGKFGKPALVSDPGLQFNISHSGEWLALAIAGDVEAGVDLQAHDPGRDVERVALRYFTDDENAQLARPGCDRRQYFYQLWSLKEAWAKARGAALPTALGAAGFTVAGSRLHCSVRGGDPDSLWLFTGEHCSLALCVLAPVCSLRLRQGSGSGLRAPPGLALTATTAGALVLD